MFRKCYVVTFENVRTENKEVDMYLAEGGGLVADHRHALKFSSEEDAAFAKRHTEFPNPKIVMN